eukprot:5118357-Amphidinium_carterae.1
MGGSAVTTGAGAKRDQRGRYLTSSDGVALCFAFHGRGCNEPCPAGRVHACQYCLGPHKNSACPTRNTESAKGKGKTQQPQQQQQSQPAASASKPQFQ